MANHCIDLICLDCGNTWCARGCNSGPDAPDPDALERFWKQTREWTATHRPDTKPEANVHRCKNDQCGACKSTNIAMD